MTRARTISPELYAALLEALHRLRIAKHAAEEVGVSPPYAWRVAKKENIKLISLAVHQQRRLADPTFRAKQKPAAREGASRWLKRKHAEPKFHNKVVAASRASLKRLNQDAAFRAASARRLKGLYADPDFRAKQSSAARLAMRRYHANNKRLSQVDRDENTP